MIFLFFATLALAAPETFFQDIEQFRQQSVNLRTEVERLNAASSRAFSRQLFWTPNLGVEAGKTKTVLNGADSNSDYWQAYANWNLFRGGSDFFTMRSSLASREAQRYQVESESLRTELQGAGYVFRSLYLREILGAQKELLQLKQESYRVGRDRFRQGKIPLQDVTKMEVDLSQTENSVRNAELEVMQNIVAFRSLFVNDIQTKSWPFQENETIALRSGQGSLDTKRLEQTAKAFENSWTAARLLHLPSIDLNLQYREYPLESRANDQWSGQISLNFPLWSRWEVSAASAEAYAGFVAASNQAAAARKEEELKREFLESKIRLSQANLLEAKKNLVKSERLYQDMLRSFQLGRLSTNDLFLEQNRRIDSVRSLAESQLSFHSALVEACALWGLSVKECLR